MNTPKPFVIINPYQTENGIAFGIFSEQNDRF